MINASDQLYQAVCATASVEAVAVFFFVATFFTAFLTVFLAAVFVALPVCAFAALANRQRFFVAEIIRFMPSALIRRLGFDGSDVDRDGGSDVPLIAAHRRCWASFMCRRAAAENFRRLLVRAAGVAAVSEAPPDSTARSSPICESMCRFCSSNPRIAALMISFVSFVGM